MKCIFFSIVLLTSAVATAVPFDRAHVSQFNTLDRTDPKYKENRTALCVKLLRNIKKDTFATARLEELYDDALFKASTQRKEYGQLKKFKAFLAFENHEYAQHCIE
jgi:hypothetical protein